MIKLKKYKLTKIVSSFLNPLCYLYLAEDTGFEPVERFTVLCFSKALHSTTLPIFQIVWYERWDSNPHFKLMKLDSKSSVSAFHHFRILLFGAESQNRTNNPLLVRQLLYLLSYFSNWKLHLQFPKSSFLLLMKFDSNLLRVFLFLTSKVLLVSKHLIVWKLLNILSQFLS